MTASTAFATASKRRRRETSRSLLEVDPLWYKDAIIYEIHVRAFCDSDGDGIGDFNGLITKLDYLQDLGITAIWLLPFYPSPLKDDGYDISDYTGVNPSYGTLADVKRFLSEAHERGIRVITELAINHTSSEHPWFQRARRSPPGSRHRNYYVWSDSPQLYSEARIIFEDFETSNWAWDPVAGAYYWHRFYSHQPDLNFDNPDVQRAVIKVLDFWMDLGVDGMRLDAVPYLYERDGTNCENLPETHAFLKRLRAHVDAKYENRMLLAEANQWPEDAAAYFGQGDECHMNFHFPVMPRLFMSVQLENRFPIVDILEQTPDIPDSCQWALFLRNHDELTLEMVTDEDRDYMYRSYAEDPRMRVNVGIRRRLSPLLKLRSKLELMNGLLMSLPGTPVLYYGDEIGQGDNVYLGDRNGVRTPMQWSGDRNAGFSRANPQKLYLPVIIDPEYHYEAINVEVHQSNPESLLWWMKRLIALRKQHQVFGRGSTTFLEPDNQKMLCFVRSYEGRQVLVAANLSRHAQYVELDLSDYRGMVPVEMSGATPFPPIGELPYLLTLGGYGFIWLELTQPEPRTLPPGAGDLPQVTGTEYLDLFRGRLGKALEDALLGYVRSRRWFRGKARKVSGLRCVEQLPLGRGATPMCLVLLRVEYASELPETYLLPIGFAVEGALSQLLEHHAHAAIAQVKLTGKRGQPSARTGVLYDPTHEPEFGRTLLAMFGRKRALSANGKLTSEPSRELRQRLGNGHGPVLEPWVPTGEQSNTTLFYGHDLSLKLFRQLEAGLNPDVEISTYLSERGFPNAAPVLGTLRYDGRDLSGATLGLMQAYIPNVGNAWDLTLDWLKRAFEEAIPLSHGDARPTLPPGGLMLDPEPVIPEAIGQMIGGYLHTVRLLATRTAELHLALSEGRTAAFAPEPFAGHYQRSILQGARDRLATGMQLLRKQLDRLPESLLPLAREVLSGRQALSQQLSAVTRIKVEVSRIRCHGDLHLGQVLYDGRDFVFIDFEGEPAVSMGVRRLKRSALYDVSGMLRSFHYAATRAFSDLRLRPDDRTQIRPWVEAWYAWVCATYLGSYLERAGDAPFIPGQREWLEALLRTHLIEKCAYELGYELNNRPDWVEVPLQGLRALMH